MPAMEQYYEQYQFGAGNVCACDLLTGLSYNFINLRATNIYKARTSHEQRIRSTDDAIFPYGTPAQLSVCRPRPALHVTKPAQCMDTFCYFDFCCICGMG